VIEQQENVTALRIMQEWHVRELYAQMSALDVVYACLNKVLLLLPVLRTLLLGMRISMLDVSVTLAIEDLIVLKRNAPLELIFLAAMEMLRVEIVLDVEIVSIRLDFANALLDIMEIDANIKQC